MTTKRVILIAVATNLAIVAIVAMLLGLVGVTGAGPLASNSGSMPHLINYQGRLTNADGTPLTGSYTMTFSLYDAATDGTACWTETQPVTATYGVFNVSLGNATPIPPTCFSDSDCYLGVTVGSDSEMTPRRRVVSVGYAYRAEDAAQAVHAIQADQAANADMVDGIDASSTPTAGALLPLDASGMFPSSVISPTVSGCGWFYSGSCPEGWTQITTGEYGLCYSVESAGASGDQMTRAWYIPPGGDHNCLWPSASYGAEGTAAFCCGTVSP